jgi:hypothetical protein
MSDPEQGGSVNSLTSIARMMKVRNTPLPEIGLIYTETPLPGAAALLSLSMRFTTSDETRLGGYQLGGQSGLDIVPLFGPTPSTALAQVAQPAPPPPVAAAPTPTPAATLPEREVLLHDPEAKLGNAPTLATIETAFTGLAKITETTAYRGGWQDKVPDNALLFIASQRLSNAPPKGQEAMARNLYTLGVVKTARIRNPHLAGVVVLEENANNARLMLQELGKAYPALPIRMVRREGEGFATVCENTIKPAPTAAFQPAAAQPPTISPPKVAEGHLILCLGLERTLAEQSGYTHATDEREVRPLVDAHFTAGGKSTSLLVGSGYKVIPDDIRAPTNPHAPYNAALLVLSGFQPYTPGYPTEVGFVNTGNPKFGPGDLAEMLNQQKPELTTTYYSPKDDQLERWVEARARTPKPPIVATNNIHTILRGR